MMRPLVIPCASVLPNNTALTSIALDAAADAVAAFFWATRAGTLSHVGLLVAAKSGTAPTYRVALETPSATGPDGGVLGSGAAKADVGDADLSVGWHWLELDAPLAVAAGQPLAITVRYLSGTISGVANISAGLRPAGIISPLQAPHALSNTTGAWARTNGWPLLAARYAEGDVPPGLGAVTQVVAHTLSSETDPLRIGSALVAPLRLRCWGASVVLTATTQHFDLEAWLGGDDAPHRAVSVDVTGVWQGSAGAAIGYVPFAAPLIVPAGETLRVVVHPTTSTAFTRFYGLAFADAASRAALGGDLFHTEAPPGSVPSWSDDEAQLAPVFPRLTGFHDGRRPRIRRLT
ncbi:MAG: hypothetical protein LC135_01965 [Phycisphaerae bacterium]|nr:hypothetical protein [Phycisphaerae bacterium]MCZ2398620.1 hypothetical protein [Phycisphaerae bacterium]